MACHPYVQYRGTDQYQRYACRMLSDPSAPSAPQPASPNALFPLAQSSNHLEPQARRRKPEHPFLLTPPAFLRRDQLNATRARVAC